MRRALVVGIDDYESAPLSGCVNDANKIASVLGTNGDGSPNFSIRLLTSPPDVIKKSHLKGKIIQLFKDPCDMSLLYFSGHGVINSTGGYIVTTDFKQYDEGVSMDEILVLANDSKATENVIILDCCHSGAFGSPAISGSRVAQISDGLSVLTASRESGSALEIDGSGVFTLLVIDALKGGGADLRGHITPGSLYSYVDQALGAWGQRPIFKTNVSRFTSLRTVNPPVPLPILRKITTYFPSPEAEHAMDPSYEFTEEAAKEENVKIMKDLQKLEGVGLVVPIDEEHMYFAAMNSKSCRLTALGHQYWRLVAEKKI